MSKSSSGGAGQQHTTPLPPILVDSRPKLAALIETAQGESVIGVDTESNSLFAYYHRVCLVQISLPGRDYVIDPLAVDVTPLGMLFASETCQKIFHAAENDILGLKRDYDFAFANIFDTMLAAAGEGALPSSSPLPIAAGPMSSSDTCARSLRPR